MGKPKQGRKKKTGCATEELHHADDDISIPMVSLRVPRRIRVDTIAELLRRCGRSSSRLTRKVCENCISRVEGPDYKRQGYVPLVIRQSTEVDLPHTSNPGIHHEEDSDIEPEDPNHPENDDMDLDISDIEPQDLDHTDNSKVGMDVSDIEHEKDMYSQCDGFTQSELSETKSNTDPVIVLSPGNLRQDLCSLSVGMRAMIAYELAAGERQNIRADVWNLTMKDFRSIDSLTDLCKPEYIDSRNPVLSHFLTGLWDGTAQTTTMPSSKYANLPVPVKEPSHIYKLAKAIEACMGLTMPIAVLPFHFREVVLLYTQTRSKTALQLLSASAPHGCYQTVLNWMEKLAQAGGSTNLPTGSGDVLCVFDNNQVLQRRWNICVDNRAMCSVVTMVMFMDIDTEGTLQFQEELKPRNWMWLGLDEAKMATLKEGHSNKIHQETRYRKHLHPWLTDIIEQVAQEQTIFAGKCTDAIDKEVASNKSAKKCKTCPSCGISDIGVRRSICPSCGSQLPTLQSQRNNKEDKEPTAKRKEKTKPQGDVRVVYTQKDETTFGVTYEREKINETEYDHLPQHHPKDPPKLRVSEPLFVNPCSYKAVANVFRRIGKEAGIKKYGGMREWLAIVCDGLPYVLGYQICERTFECGLCGLSVHGLGECENHQEEHNKKGEGDCRYKKEFDWVLLQPGPGHIEMNMLKTFVKFAWPVFWEDMVELFNFKSEIAKRSALNASDHHKGMTLAKIARESFAKELVLPYVRQQLLEGGELSAAGYLDFSLKTVKSPNYALMGELTLTMLDALFLYRAGLRCGDTAMMNAGRAIFARMWVAQSHPMYRQLVMYDNIMSACMPPEVYEFIKKTQSFNLHGNDYAGEGADFKLEEINKLIQHLIPAVPSNKDWIKACANFEHLNNLKETTLSEMELKNRQEGSSKSRPDLKPEISALRTAIRESKFIAKHDTKSPITSLGKEPLDEDLADFAQTAAKNEAIYLENFINHQRTGGFMKKVSVPFNEPPVFVTPEERIEYNKIENKTVSELLNLINTKIEKIADEDMRGNWADAFQSDVLSKKGKKKQDYIDFYELLEEYETYDMDLDSMMQSTNAAPSQES